MSSNTTCEFAIYYIPTDDRFYTIGSRIIGYDIKSEKLVNLSTRHIPIKNLNKTSKINGFHLTITDVVTIDKDKLDLVISKTKKIFEIPIFRNLILKKRAIQIMPNANVFAIVYRKSLKLLLLHALLVVLVQTLGYSSIYLLKINDLSLIRKIKTKLFLSPYILDEYLPHISLVSNIDDSNKNLVAKIISTQVSNEESLTLDKLAIVVRNKGERYFRVSQYIG